MDIVAAILIGTAVLLIPVAIWGDRWASKLLHKVRTKLYAEKAWLIRLEKLQLVDLGQYLFTIIHSIDYKSLANTKAINVKVELVNMTIFALERRLVGFNATCNGYPVGIEKQDLVPKNQASGQRDLPTTIEYSITNEKFLDYFKQACINKQVLNWQFHIKWGVKVKRYDSDLLCEDNPNFQHIPDLSSGEIDAL